MRSLRVVLAIIGLVATLIVAAPSAAQAATTTVRYGPFTVPANGMLDQVEAWSVDRPCSNCFITGMYPNLTYADGSTANVDTGIMLHHMVLASAWKTDPTCGGTNTEVARLGQRFFASGNERTGLSLPAGYGYRVGMFDPWNMVVDIMNHDGMDQTVYIDIRFEWASASSNLTEVRPVWLDIDQCGDSEVPVPAGQSDTHYSWKVNVPGQLVAIGGHVHEGGVNIEATKETRKRSTSICNSVAGYGETPDYIDMMGMEYISSMSTCQGTPITSLTTNDTVRIHANYDTMEPMTDAMGIMIAFIDPV